MKKKPNGYWTLEICIEDALKYKNRIDWQTDSPTGYQKARKNNWLDECCKHMTNGNTKYCNWTLEICIEDALKYKSRTDWKTNSQACYTAARNKGYLDVCYAHMIKLTKNKEKFGYWTLELCKEDALKYNTKKEWQTNSPSVYSKVYKKGWLDDCCAHMEEVRKPNDYWTLERCKEDALKFKTKVEWEANSCSGYSSAVRNKWVNECCGHMIEGRKPNNYWDLENCKEYALKYNTKVEWQSNSPTSYSIAQKKGWHNECCAHMIECQKQRGYWTFERCKEDALNYKTKVEWRLNSPKGYGATKRNGWLKECCAHMDILQFRTDIKLDLINELQHSDLINMSPMELMEIIDQGYLPSDFDVLENSEAYSEERIATLKELQERYTKDDTGKPESLTASSKGKKKDNKQAIPDGDFTEVDDVDGDITKDITDGEPKLPSINIMESLHNLDNPRYASMDDESFEALVHYKLHYLWNHVLNNNVSAETIGNEDGGKFYNIIKERFLQEYEVCENYKPRGDYSFKYQPNLMQKLVVHRLMTYKSYGNFSGTGAGKTLSFIISSRELDARLTLVVAVNSTIPQTVESIKNVYPSSTVFTEYKQGFVFDRSKHNYLVLNYEKFQQTYSEELLQSLTNNNQIDFIVVDEVHNVKQRNEGEESKRHAVINRLFGRARENNPDTHTLMMSATPVTNELYEAKSILMMMTGLEYEDVDTRRTLSNARTIYKLLNLNGLRFMPKYDINVTELTGHNMTNLNIDGSHLVDKLLAVPHNKITDIEKVLVGDKLKSIKPYLKKGVIIYSYYTSDIVKKIQKYVSKCGYRCGTYTGEESTFTRDENLNRFRGFDDEGKAIAEVDRLDILIGSKPIGTGVDGLQHICDRMILMTLPWTDSEYTQLKGRIYRQGSKFEEVEFIIPQVRIDMGDGDFWSWDIQRMNLIKNKKTLADAAVDGVVPSKILPTRDTMCKKAMESLDIWKERINSGNIVTINRSKMKIELYPEIKDDAKRRERAESYLNDFHQKANTSLSSTIHKEFTDNPGSWFEYHATRNSRIEQWDEIPYEHIATKIKDKRDIIADFGCGENLFSKCVPNNVVYAFDHVAIDETVTACDMRDTGLGSESVDVAVFSLALWGVNHKDYIVEANRILKRRGLIYISEPSSKFDTQESQDKLVGMLNECGFQILGNIENRGKFIYVTGIKI